MDEFDAIVQIQQIARERGLAVSIITADDVLLLKGVENGTDEQRDAVQNSWEFRHYGDNWTNWFEGFDLSEVD